MKNSYQLVWVANPDGKGNFVPVMAKVVKEIDCFTVELRNNFSSFAYQISKTEVFLSRENCLNHIEQYMGGGFFAPVKKGDMIVPVHGFVLRINTIEKIASFKTAASILEVHTSQLFNSKEACEDCIERLVQYV